MSAPPEAIVAAPRRTDGLVGRIGLALGPIVLAFIATAILLAILGRDPVKFYSDILLAGILRPSGLQDSITRMAPVLLVGAGLIVSFRASLWNLGADGQYLLAVAMVAGIGSRIIGDVPLVPGWIILALAAMLIAGAWTIVPAILKARYGLNEIVTTLMMSFIGVGLANLLVKGPFKGDHMVPQTEIGRAHV